MTEDQFLARLIADNEQDAAAVLEWWRSHPRAAKMALWDAIQVHHDDPIAETVTRFAQLKFGEMAEKYGI